VTAFTTLTSRLAPLPIENVDTDQIIPANYLKVTDRQGLAEGLFERWRRRADGSPDPDFVLNRPEFEGAEILLAGDNFGCGSSREHAPWALQGGGFKAVISSRFADIFRSNSLKNGLLVVTVPPDVLAGLFEAVTGDSSTSVSIDLESQKLTLPSGDEVSFSIDAFAKHCLLNDIDQLGYLLEKTAEIERFEERHPARVSTID
jgi:3-isopropylmalate/(R)-2-methylmalate dehydratase small subunit